MPRRLIAATAVLLLTAGCAASLDPSTEISETVRDTNIHYLDLSGGETVEITLDHGEGAHGTFFWLSDPSGSTVREGETRTDDTWSFDVTEAGEDELVVDAGDRGHVTVAIS